MSRKYLFSLISSLSLLLIILTERAFEQLHNNFLREYEEGFLNNLFLILIASLISLTIFSFKNKAYLAWFKYFFIWYFPLAYLLTFTFPTYGGLMTTTRSGAAIFFGAIMVVITLVWVVYSHFKTSSKALK